MKIVKNKGVTWIDIVKPTKDDIDFLAKQHKFHPVILDELLHTSVRSRVESYDNYFYLTYHLPVYEPTMRTSRRAEIDFLVTKNTVITVRYEELEPINNFTRSIMSNPHFKETSMMDTGRLMYALIEEILSFSMRQLRHIEENITNLTQELFTGREDAMLRKISYIKRDLLDYRIISRPQEILLQSLRHMGLKFWGEDMAVYLSDLCGDHLKVLQFLENYKETIESLEETNAQLLDAKTNSVMQTFNILAFLAIPMFFVLQFFSTSVEGLNAVLGGNLKIFFISFLAVIVVTVASVVYFRKKRLL